MDRRGLRPPHDVERDGLVGVTTQAANLKIRVPRVERIAKRQRRLCRTLEGEHALGPGVAGELVGFPARLSRALGRYAAPGSWFRASRYDSRLH